MMTLDERLNALVALLPEREQPRFTAPLAVGESIEVSDKSVATTLRTRVRPESLLPR